MLVVASTSLVTATSIDKRQDCGQVAYPNATAILFGLPDCPLEGTGISVQREVISDVPPNTCMASSVSNALPTGKFLSFLGYRSGTVPGGSKCDFHVYFRANCEGLSIANQFGAYLDCANTLHTPHAISSDGPGMSFQWICRTL